MTYRKLLIRTAQVWFDGARDESYTWPERLLNMENALNHTENALSAALRRDRCIADRATLKDLWQPISKLKDRDTGDLLLCAPELVDADCNPHGVAPGYWQDGPLTEGGSEEGEWIAAGYCMQHDHFVNRVCNPTHFLLIEGPGDD